MSTDNVNIGFQKNRLFAKYGHECDLANELDVLPLLIPGTGIGANIRRAIIRARMVSEISKHSNKFFRSQGAIAAEKNRHLRDHPYIIHPFSDARKWWEFFMCWIFLLQFFMIPLDIAYFSLGRNTFFQHKLWKWTRMTLDCWCLTDVCINFATGYYHYQKKQAVLAPHKIALHYLGSLFVPDFLSSLPTHIDLFINITSNGTLALQTFSILKMFRFLTFRRYFMDYLESIEISFAIFKLSITIITSLIYFHFIACMLIFIFSFELGPSGNHWFRNTSNTLIKNGSYTGAFYCALITINNCGYGLAPPERVVDIYVVCVVWIFSRVLVVLVIGRIMQVLQAASSANHKYIEMVRQLREYMRHRQLPEYMQRRLLTYYEFRFQKSYFRESEILSTISGQLRQEIVMHSCRKLVENVAFFKNLPLTLLVRIVSCLHSEVFLINDVIVRANTPGNSMFFIASGTVAVYSSSGREICHLEDGAHFGEIALVMKDELRVASVVAVEVCELYRLNRKEFVRAIHPYPDLLDNIQRIAADRMERTTMIDEHNRREMACKRFY